MVPERIASLFRRRRIDSPASLADFVRAEAARVAQVSLLGYLRARMGVRWPVHFQDPGFAPAIEAAQKAGFQICLADLVVFVMAETQAGDRASDRGGDRNGAAGRLFAAAGGADEAGFARRLARHDWQGPADRAFDPSLSALIGVAPVVDAYRDEDAEGFANALALRWAEVRRRFRARADMAALAAALAT